MIAIGCDHTALDFKGELIAFLQDRGEAPKDFGVTQPGPSDYPVIAKGVAEAVASGECDRGILICGTGVGMSIAANKIAGIRCVNCSEPYSAKLSRQHNNSNILSLGARVLGLEAAKMIVSVWLETEYEGGRHDRRVQMLADLD